MNERKLKACQSVLQKVIAENRVNLERAKTAEAENKRLREALNKPRGKGMHNVCHCCDDLDLTKQALTASSKPAEEKK